MKKRMDSDKVEKCKLVANAKTCLWCLCSMYCTTHVPKTLSGSNNTHETIYQNLYIFQAYKLHVHHIGSPLSDLVDPPPPW